LDERSELNAPALIPKIAEEISSASAISTTDKDLFR
jgi:hypothetical protein